MMRLFTLWAAGLLALLLGGCSGMRLIESEVRTSTPAQAPAIVPGAHYRFERLPSQTDTVAANATEVIAEAELNKVGLVHDDQDARYSVQITSRVESYLVDDYWGRPYGGGFTTSIYIGRGVYGGGYGYGMGPMFGWGMRYPPTSQYRHEVTLLLRDLQSNQVVYETRALHEGPWNDHDNILHALLAAALQGFPTPPAGVRRVKIEIPR